jgi:hypothetical protein
MIDKDQAALLSEALDDGRPLPPEASEHMHLELRRHRRVDAMLRAAAPRMKSPSPRNLAASIMTRLDEVNPESGVPRRVGYAPWFAMAAALVIAGLAWMAADAPRRLAAPSSGPGVYSSDLISAPRSPFSFAMTLENPYRTEAKRLRDDAAAATDAVLSRIPIAAPLRTLLNASDDQR